MKFSLDEEQRAFASALDEMLSDADVPAVVRAWTSGETNGALELWERLAELGALGLSVPETDGGAGATPVDLVVAAGSLGWHCVPGPWIESVAVAPVLLAGARNGELLGEIAKGTARVSIAAPPVTPYALDAATATHVLLAGDDGLAAAAPGPGRGSVDPSRTLHPVTGTGAPTPLPDGTLDAALDLGALACAAALVGAADRMLASATEHAGQRHQFGRAIGEHQAVKHQLADVKVGLDFARPLVLGAAREIAAGSPTARRTVSAAKVAASTAAHRAARTALQVHGAIGYTRESDLSTCLLRTRALIGAWGTPAHHRARVLDELAAA
ncbi:acyl-CoA dehydrogenase family protein [Saccharopolyspora griseoalba]|uniref:Acyl-CoA dehydrogenase family protein n=1 Tax=Saccharopolyspora griseoalba TaxID=1431848 RepID=A0ABW2LEJ4_9PSEU